MGMYHQEKAYQCTILSCKTISNLIGRESIAEEVSMIKYKDIELAVNRNDADLGFSGGIASKWLK